MARSVSKSFFFFFFLLFFLLLLLLTIYFYTLFYTFLFNIVGRNGGGGPVFSLEGYVEAGGAKTDANYGYIGRLEYDADPTTIDTGRGTVCNDGWKIDPEHSVEQATANAKVACSVMGLAGGTYLGSTGEKSYEGQSYELAKQTAYATTTATSLTSMSCLGNETDDGMGGLKACRDFGTSSCTGKIEDVVISCTRPEGIPASGYEPTPPGGTWNDANQYCIQRGWQLCSMHDYCPDGVGTVPKQEQLGSLRDRVNLLFDETIRWAPISDVTNDWLQVSGSNGVDLSNLCRSWIDTNPTQPMGPDGGAPSGEDGKTFRCCPCPDIVPGWSHIVTQWERDYTTRKQAPRFKNIYVDGTKLTKDRDKTLSSTPRKLVQPNHLTAVVSDTKDTYTSVSGARFSTQFATSFDAQCGDKGRTIQVRVTSGSSTSSFKICTTDYSDCYPYTDNTNNWKSYGTNSKGFNVVLIDPSSGEITQTGTFDTDAANAKDSELNKMLRSGTAESIVLISVNEQGVPPSNRVSAKNYRGLSDSAAILNTLTGGYIDDRVSSGDGLSEETAASDCSQLKASGITSSVSKAYWIQPLPNSPAVKVYCDLSDKAEDNADGGGWTLVYKITGASTMSTTKGFPTEANTNTDALQQDQITYSSSAKLSDDYIKALCTDQFRVVQTDETGLSTGSTCNSDKKCSSNTDKTCSSYEDCVLNPLYCRFSNIEEYSDVAKSTKYCSTKYLEDSSYSNSDDTDRNLGFSTDSVDGAVITQLYNNGDSNGNSGSKLKRGESSHSGCTSDGGCHVQIWCKSLFVQQKEELNIGSSFALISSLTTNALPTWKRFNTLKSTEGDSFVESSIALSPISQPLYIGGTYRHSTSETPVDVGVFRLYPKHLTAEESKGNYNALAPRYGKNTIARRRTLRDDTPGVSSVFGISRVPGAAEVAKVAKHRRRRLAYETNVEMGTLDAGSATPISLIIPSFSKNMQDIGGLGDYFEVCGVSDATSNCPTTSLKLTNINGEFLLANREFNFFMQAHRKMAGGGYQSGPFGSVKAISTSDAEPPGPPASIELVDYSIVVIEHPTEMGGAQLKNCEFELAITPEREPGASKSKEPVWTVVHIGQNTTIDLSEVDRLNIPAGTVFIGLQTRRKYPARVRCRNDQALAMGPYSEEVIVDGGSGRPPKQPTNVVFSKQTGTELTVGWSPPFDTGSMELIGYLVSYRAIFKDGTTGTWTTTKVVGGAVTSLRVEGLLEFQMYGFQILAQNSAYFCPSVGNGAYSETAYVSSTVELVTPKPTRPEKGAMLPRGGSIDVMWGISPIVTNGGLTMKEPSTSSLNAIKGFTLYRGLSPRDNFQDVYMLVGQTNDGIQVSGVWREMTDAKGNAGLVSQGQHHGTSSVEFAPLLPVQGVYDIQIMWPETPSDQTRSAQVPIVVEHSEGSYSVTINQDGASNHGVWYQVGTFTMMKGAKQSRLTVGTSGVPSSNFVSISQARFVLKSIAIDSTAFDGFSKLATRNFDENGGVVAMTAQEYQSIGVGGTIVKTGTAPILVDPPYYEVIDSSTVYRTKSYSINQEFLLTGSKRHDGTLGRNKPGVGNGRGRLSDDSQGWSARQNNPGENFWELDLAKPMLVVGGRIACRKESDQCIQKYKVQVSNDGGKDGTWVEVDNNADFIGNENGQAGLGAGNDQVDAIFLKSYAARYVRITPVECNGHCSARFAVLVAPDPVCESAAGSKDLLWDSYKTTCFRFNPHTHAALDGQSTKKMYISTAGEDTWQNAGTTRRLSMTEEIPLWLRFVEGVSGTQNTYSLESCVHPGTYLHIANHGDASYNGRNILYDDNTTRVEMKRLQSNDDAIGKFTNRGENAQPWTGPCKRCEGDCNSDDMCEDGLKCLLRVGAEPEVPGCEGTATNDWGYCIVDEVSDKKGYSFTIENSQWSSYYRLFSELDSTLSITHGGSSDGYGLSVVKDEPLNRAQQEASAWFVDSPNTATDTLAKCQQRCSNLLNCNYITYWDRSGDDGGKRKDPKMLNRCLLQVSCDSTVLTTAEGSSMKRGATQAADTVAANNQGAETNMNTMPFEVLTEAALLVSDNNISTAWEADACGESVMLHMTRDTNVDAVALNTNKVNGVIDYEISTSSHSDSGWEKFWWWTPLDVWPNDENDVFGYPFGSCKDTAAKYCFQSLPSFLKEDSTELRVVEKNTNGDVEAVLEWTFNPTNNVAHAAWNAMINGLETPAGEMKDQNNWVPKVQKNDAGIQTYLYSSTWTFILSASVTAEKAEGVSVSQSGNAAVGTLKVALTNSAVSTVTVTSSNGHLFDTKGDLVIDGTTIPLSSLSSVSSFGGKFDSFMYRVEGGVRSLLLDDNNCECGSVLSLGHSMCDGSCDGTKCTSTSFGVDSVMDSINDDACTKPTTSERTIELYYRDMRKSKSQSWNSVDQSMILKRSEKDNAWYTLMLDTVLNARYLRFKFTTCHDATMTINEIRLLSKTVVKEADANQLAVDSGYQFQVATNAWSWTTNEAMRFEGALFPQSSKFAFSPTMSVERGWMKTTGEGAEALECSASYNEFTGIKTVEECNKWCDTYEECLEFSYSSSGTNAYRCRVSKSPGGCSPAASTNGFSLYRRNSFIGIKSCESSDSNCGYAHDFDLNSQWAVASNDDALRNTIPKRWMRVHFERPAVIDRILYKHGSNGKITAMQLSCPPTNEGGSADKMTLTSSEIIDTSELQIITLPRPMLCPSIRLDILAPGNGGTGNVGIAHMLFMAPRQPSGITVEGWIKPSSIGRPSSAATWQKFWWLNKANGNFPRDGKFPKDEKDVLQYVYGTKKEGGVAVDEEENGMCGASSDYCFQRLPSSLDIDCTDLMVEIVVDADTSKRFQWSFDSKNPVAQAAWRAFRHGEETVYDELRNSEYNWDPTPIDETRKTGSFYTGQNSFMYRMENTVRSLVLWSGGADENCDARCQTTMSLGASMSGAPSTSNNYDTGKFGVGDINMDTSNAASASDKTGCSGAKSMGHTLRVYYRDSCTMSGAVTTDGGTQSTPRAMRESVKGFPTTKLTMETWMKCQERDPRSVWSSMSKSGLLGWWDSSDYLFTNTQGETRLKKTDWGNVREWKDRSGEFTSKVGPSLLADVSSSKKNPVVGTHTATGRPIVSFTRKTGVNQKLSTNQDAHSLDTSNIAAIMVLRVDVKGGTFEEGDATWCDIMQLTDQYAKYGNIRIHLTEDGTLKAIINKDASSPQLTIEKSGAVTNAEEWFVMSLTNEINTETKQGIMKLRLNGKEVGTTSYSSQYFDGGVGQPDLKPIDIGGMCNKDVGELIMFNEKVTTSRLEGMERYLMDKWMTKTTEGGKTEIPLSRTNVFRTRIGFTSTTFHGPPAMDKVFAVPCTEVDEDGFFIRDCNDGDDFDLTVESVTRTGFVLKVERKDDRFGWQVEEENKGCTQKDVFTSEIEATLEECRAKCDLQEGCWEMSHDGSKCRYAMSFMGCQPCFYEATKCPDTNGWKHYTRGWNMPFKVKWHAREMQSSSPSPTVMSYATEDEPLSFHFGCDGQVAIAGETVSTGVSLYDGEWHHVAVSWDSMTGVVRAYDNGEMKLNYGVGMVRRYITFVASSVAKSSLAELESWSGYSVASSTWDVNHILMETFETPADNYDNFYERIDGLFVPTMTGEHTFVLSSLGEAGIYISDSEDSLNLKRIADTAGCTKLMPRELNSCTNQKSASQMLEVGKMYYFRVVRTAQSRQPESQHLMVGVSSFPDGTKSVPLDLAKYFMLAPESGVAGGKSISTGGTLAVGQAQSAPGIAALSTSGDKISIDELRLWTTVRLQEEIQFEMGSLVHVDVPSRHHSLWSYWRFNDDQRIISTQLRRFVLTKVITKTVGPASRLVDACLSKNGGTDLTGTNLKVSECIKTGGQNEANQIFLVRADGRVTLGSDETGCVTYESSGSKLVMRACSPMLDQNQLFQVSDHLLFFFVFFFCFLLLVSINQQQLVCNYLILMPVCTHFFCHNVPWFTHFFSFNPGQRKRCGDDRAVPACYFNMLESSSR